MVLLLCMMMAKMLIGRHHEQLEWTSPDCLSRNKAKHEALVSLSRARRTSISVYPTNSKIHGKNFEARAYDWLYRLPFEHSSPESQQCRYVAVEAYTRYVCSQITIDTEARWKALLFTCQTDGIKLRDHEGFLELMNGGIPSSLRGQVWMQISGARSVSSDVLSFWWIYLLTFVLQ